MRGLLLHATYPHTLKSFWECDKSHMQMKLYDPQGYKLLKRLRLGFSHLRKYNFQDNFADALKPLCSCALETESTSFFSMLSKLCIILQGPYK